MDTDAKRDVPLRRQRRVAIGQGCLHLRGASQRVDDTGELDQEAVAGGLDEAPVMFGDARVDDLPPQCPQGRQRALFVDADQPRIADDIGGEDRG